MKGGTGPLILVALFSSLAYGINLSKCFIRISNRTRPFRETIRTTTSQHARAESVVAYHSSKMQLSLSWFSGRSEKSKEPRVLVSEGNVTKNLCNVPKVCRIQFKRFSVV